MIQLRPHLRALAALLLGASLLAVAPAGGPALVRAADGCTITGTERNDRLNGTAGNDVICGLGGNDTINGLAGNDVIDGGAGADRIVGGNGNDQIDGGIGRDQIDGGNGNDALSGGVDIDVLSGGQGNDTLNGGAGTDRLNGGSGTNTCTWDQREVRTGTCAYDMTAPEIIAVSLSTSEVDITDTAAEFSLDITVSDNRDGILAVYPGSFIISSYEGIAPTTIEQIGGDSLSATFRATYFVLPSTRPAEYTIMSISVIDHSQNVTTLDFNALEDRGWPSKILVTSDTPFESEPPAVLAVRFSSTQVSRSAYELLTIDVEVADAGVGIPNGSVFLTYFKDVAFRDWYYIQAGERISGDDAAATYRFSFTFPAGAGLGLWTLGGVWVVDANRNATYLLDGELLARGFDARVILNP